MLGNERKACAQRYREYRARAEQGRGKTYSAESKEHVPGEATEERHHEDGPLEVLEDHREEGGILGTVAPDDEGASATNGENSDDGEEDGEGKGGGEDGVEVVPEEALDEVEDDGQRGAGGDGPVGGDVGGGGKLVGERGGRPEEVAVELAEGRFGEPLAEGVEDHLGAAEGAVQ